jgi:hypothetical protein
MRFAMTSKMSVAVVLMAPVIMMAACRCMAVSLFMIPWLDFPSFDLVAIFRCGVRKMSAAYNICGTAIERYSLRTYFALALLDALVMQAN